MKLASKYIKGMNPEAIEDIEWVQAGVGEAGWTIYLNPGWSFWSGGIDAARWVPADTPEEAMGFQTFKVEE